MPNLRSIFRRSLVRESYCGQRNRAEYRTHSAARLYLGLLCYNDGEQYAYNDRRLPEAVHDDVLVHDEVVRALVLVAQAEHGLEGEQVAVLGPQ